MITPGMQQVAVSVGTAKEVVHKPSPGVVHMELTREQADELRELVADMAQRTHSALRGAEIVLSKPMSRYEREAHEATRLKTQHRAEVLAWIEGKLAAL